MKNFQIIAIAMLASILGVSAAPALLKQGAPVSFGCPYVPEFCEAICLSQADASGRKGCKGVCIPGYFDICHCVYRAINKGDPELGKPTRTVIPNPPTGDITVTRTVILPTGTVTRTVIVPTGTVTRSITKV